MLEVFDLSRKRVAVLGNAHAVTETKKLNAVSQMTFKLPTTDEKAKFCKPRYFVRYDSGDLYRIIDYTVDTDNTEEMTYQCEHVIATLVDGVLFQDHQVDNLPTRQSINYILSRQSNWTLGECDFSHMYSYAWTSENLLAALWSIATPFADYYKFVFNTQIYPWSVSLKRIDLSAAPQFYVFAGFNFLRGAKTTYSSEVVTRLYCLGYGEGVNQLDIKSVNNGVPYLQAPAGVIQKYGLIEAVWTDRRYEDAQSLKDAGAALLAELQEPRVEYSFDVADLYAITHNDYYKAEVGRVMMFKDDNYKTYITGITVNHDTGAMTMTVANKPQDLAGTIADLADRQRIEATYAQGATQLWGSPLQDNASPTQPLVYNLWVPSDLRVMNRVQAKIKLSKFRAYSQTAKTTDQTSTDDGGGSTESISLQWGMEEDRTAIGQPIYGGSGIIMLNVITEAEGHTHGIKDHRHVFFKSAIDHTHTFDIPNHSHSIRGHLHDIEPGIFLVGDAPVSAIVKINDVQKFTFSGTNWEGDITQHLLSDGSIPRGQFIEIQVFPNTNAYVTISVAAQGFIQSKAGGKY